MAQMHGGRLVAKALKAEGTTAVFVLTGGHIVPILDGCVQEDIRIVDVRHEQTAAHAAEAYTRLTGKLGVALVTAAPGVTNTVTGVLNAHFSHTPMLVIGGRHLVRQEHTGGLQEMDHPPLFRSITKLATTAWETERLAEYIAIAARHAFSGRGGPVFLDIPLDVQGGMVDEDAVIPHGHRANAVQGADQEVVELIAGVLENAERPVVFAGGGVGGSDVAALADVVEALDAPTYLNAGARGSLPRSHPQLGVWARSQAFRGADVVVALGVDWDFRTGYGAKIADDATIVQVDSEATKIGWNRTVHHGIVAHPGRFLGQLAKLKERFAVTDRPWMSEIREAENERQRQADTEAEDDAEPIMPQRFGRDVAAFFGPDSIIAVDGGDIVSTTAKWLEVAHPGHVLEPGPAGTLGTGPGFALAAKVVHPDRRVGIVFGDGGFGFNGFEYDTFVRHGLDIIGVIGNDGVWSNIKTFHRMFYGDRVVASDLGRRPYHDVVTALGGHGELVTHPGDLTAALDRAAASGKPSLVNVHLAETTRASSNYGG